MLHNLKVNLDTKDLIEAYDISIRFKDIYHYVRDGRLSGNAKTQKKIAGEANSYVTVNNLLFKIVQYKGSGKWVHYLPLVRPEKYEAHIMNMYHNSLLAMHQGPYKTFLTIRKQFHFPTCYQNCKGILKHVQYAKDQNQKESLKDHITEESQLIIFLVKTWPLI